MLARAVDMGRSDKHNATGSTSFWTLKVRCRRWLFGNKTSFEKVHLRGAPARRVEVGERGAEPGNLLGCVPRLARAPLHHRYHLVRFARFM